jgi:hypothetical protein
MKLESKIYLRFLAAVLRTFFVVLDLGLLEPVACFFVERRFGVDDSDLSVAAAVSRLAAEMIIPAVVPTVLAMLVSTSLFPDFFFFAIAPL